MDSLRIRESFHGFFEGAGHRRVPSASLIPPGDATLLFTNAGMVPFKDAFLGSEAPPSPRCVSVQRCVRAGGKHNDLDRVGFTRRHHTFFEMMGNFSFGDYFKKEAIAFAWEYLTKTVGLSPSVLWVTVFTDDDEAAGLWQSVAGVDPSRIVRLGEKDNFWQMGNTGPCGPCSEILVDQGPAFSCGRPTCAVGCDCDRYLEIWNLVFMQYDRNDAGVLTRLPRPSIDTGMGLERLASVLQGAESNFETDLFLPLMEAIGKNTRIPYGRGKGEKDFAYRVIADHVRASTFLVWEGLVPSNEGRGYVLRRFIRRAMQFSLDLGLPTPFLPDLSRRFSELMASPYPELSAGMDRVVSVLASEEERFMKTLEIGLPLVQELAHAAKKRGEAVLSGEELFWLYDTHGIPVDVVLDWAAPLGVSLDTEGFTARMGEQKEQGRRSWTGGRPTFPVPASRLSAPVLFEGYERLESSGRLLLLVSGDQEIASAREGEEIWAVTDISPFYPEGGGQAGDRGRLVAAGGTVEISGAYRPYPGWIALRGTVTSGMVSSGETVSLEVDRSLRAGARVHHTATHLLHAALRKVLGSHVRQAGSLVLPDRLRFDFSHGEPISESVLREIEATVNRWIGEGAPVSISEKSKAEALSGGAMAFFGEKYGDRVRVVEIPGMSVELCGGTHAGSTSEIGSFFILSESGVAAGTRRIEAVAGASATRTAIEWREELLRIREELKVPSGRILDRLSADRTEREELERELAKNKSRLFDLETETLLSDSFEAGGILVLVAAVECRDLADLRLRMDILKGRIPSGAVILAGRSGGDRVLLLGWASSDLEKRFPVNTWVRTMAQTLGGRGGGRPLWAEGGGSPPPSWPDFLRGVRSAMRDAAENAQGGS
ncbi:MAG: alanine--tRNA ligase [Leptospirillia bacterium]